MDGLESLLPVSHLEGDCLPIAGHESFALTPVEEDLLSIFSLVDEAEALL